MKLLILFALLSSPLIGAIAFVQASSGSTQSSVTAISTTATATTNGHTLIVFACNTTSSSATANITDTATDSFTLISYTNYGGADRCGEWVANNISGLGSNVVTATWSTAVIYTGISVLEFSGLNTNSLDQFVVISDPASSNSITSPAFTTTVSNEVIVGGAYSSAVGQTFTPDTGYTIPSNATVPDQFLSMEYKIVSSIQTGVTTTMSATPTTAPWDLIVGTFKIASGGSNQGKFQSGIIF